MDVLKINLDDLKIFQPKKIEGLAKILPNYMFKKSRILMHFGNETFKVMDNYKESIDTGRCPRSRWKKMTLNEYFEKHRDVIGSMMISEEKIADSILKEVTLLYFLKTTHIQSARFFSGRKDCTSDLHFDWISHWLFQINLFGTKLFYLFPPESSKFMNARSNLSKLDFRSFSDNEKETFTKKANGFKCIVKSGEGMLIPPFWWHHVEYKSSAASLSIGFGETQDYINSFLNDPLVPRNWRLAILFSFIMQNGGISNKQKELCEIVREIWRGRRNKTKDKINSVWEALQDVLLNLENPANLEKDVLSSRQIMV